MPGKSGKYILDTLSEADFSFQYLADQLSTGDLMAYVIFQP